MISNERLEELIAGHEKAKKAARIIVPNLDTPVGDALLECLQELQRYRQAATAGVEEAANKLVRFVEAKISEWLPGELTLDDDDAQAVRDFLTALLAPYMAKSAGVEEAAERLYDAVAQVSIGGSYNVPHRLAVPVIREHLTALVAERDAVLSECREYVQDAVDEQSRGRELLAKIDALTEGGGE